MKEYDLFIPLYYNDGTPIEPQKFQVLQQQLLAQFGGLTFGPRSLLDLPKLHLEWYAWTMQGGSKPEFLRKPVAYYVMYADK